MIRKYKFKEYQDESFRDFVRAMSDLYKIGQIRFSPHQGKGLFNAFQLRHICPDWDIQHPNGFLCVWAQHRDVVKTITFEMFRPSGSPSIQMTIDLRRNIFSLDQTVGVAPEEVVSVLKRYFDIKDVTFLELARETVLTVFAIAMASVAGILLFVTLGFLLTWLDITAARNSGIPREPNSGDVVVEKTKEIVGEIFSSDHRASDVDTATSSDTAGVNEQRDSSNNSPAISAKNSQAENMSASQIVWWKDTLWGYVFVAVVTGLIIAFLVYILGLNK